MHAAALPAYFISMQPTACRKLDFSSSFVQDIKTSSSAAKAGSSTDALSIFSSCPVTPLKRMQISANRLTPPSQQNTPKALFCLKTSKNYELISQNKSNSTLHGFIRNQEKLDSVCREQSEKMRQVLNEQQQELEKLCRIGNFAENFGSLTNVSANGNRSSVAGNLSLNPTISQEELSFLKNLNLDEMHDVYESECYKRKHAEAKIILLQKQNLDLEQRLSVSNGLNQRKLNLIHQLSNNLDSFLKDLLTKDMQRDEKCGEIMEENVKLSEAMHDQMCDMKKLSQNVEEFSSNLIETQNQLEQMKDKYARLETEHGFAKKQLAECQEMNGFLNEQKRKLEDDLKRQRLSEEQSKSQLITSEKLYTELATELKKLKNELNAQKSAHLSEIDKIESANKAVNLEIMQDYEKRLQEQRDELESKKLYEIRRLKTEFEASLTLYDEKFREILIERDSTARKLKSYETSFEENLRIMYYTVQQKLASKYYELVSEFASPIGIGAGHSANPPTNQNRPSSSQSTANYNAAAGAITSCNEHKQRPPTEHEISADEFLAKLQKSDPLSSFRNMYSTNESANALQSAATVNGRNNGNDISTGTSKLVSNFSGLPNDPQNKS